MTLAGVTIIRAYFGGENRRWRVWQKHERKNKRGEQNGCFQAFFT